MNKIGYSVVVLVGLGGALLVASSFDTTGSGPASLAPPSRAHVHEAPASRPGGGLKISAGSQQIIGLRVSRVERAAVTHTLRLLGRVAPDETRLYRVNAGVEGAIHDVSAVTTGSEVGKDQLLATFSAPQTLSAIQTYILNVGGADRLRQRAAEGSVEAQGLPLASANIRQRVDLLRNYGVSALQMEEISRTRQVPDSIKILAPADGVVLARNVSPGLKFERGFELYRIADLRHVWVLADVFEGDTRHVRPGARARIALPAGGPALPATVAAVLPQFDATTRALKVRLEVDNPGLVLRPDMFVDVELSVALPPMIAVPADAVVDSGLTRTVFVGRDDETFEPRQVRTGRRFGDRVEILEGLAAGERVVTAGTFLLDSESRMRPLVSGTVGARQAEPAPTGSAHGTHGGAAHEQAIHAHGEPSR